MANEIKATLSIIIANGEYNERIADGQQSYTQAAIGEAGGVVSVGSGAEEDLVTTDISMLGWCYLKNLDSTNYVTYGPKSGGVMVGFGRLKAGEEAWFRLEPGVTLRWQANTAAVKVKVRVYEN